MANTIKVTYVMPEAVEPKEVPELQVCNTFELGGNAAADQEVFAEQNSWYDNNVYGLEDTVERLEKFFNEQVAHPGLVALLRKAMFEAAESEDKTATVTATTDNAKEALYLGEVKKAVEDYGFTIEIS